MDSLDNMGAGLSALLHSGAYTDSFILHEQSNEDDEEFKPTPLDPLERIGGCAGVPNYCREGGHNYKGSHFQESLKIWGGGHEIGSGKCMRK